MAKKNMLKQKRVINEDMTNIRNMVILLVIVIGVCIGIYFLTEYMIKRDSNISNTNTEAIIDYDIATIGTMFNRIESEYFVLLYSSNDDGKNLDSVLSTYRSSDNYIKTYYVDLDKKINQIAISDETVRTPNNSNEVKVNGATLYRIKDGIVVNCYSGVDDITNALQ